MRLGLFGYWMNSYWGGAAAATGGALVLGALPRVMRGLRTRHTVVMAVGAALLAISRPYEGGAMCLGAAGVAIAWLFGKHAPPLGASLARFVAPMFVLLSMTAAGIGYYSYRITGSPLRPPHVLQLEGKPAAAPLFLWQTNRPEGQFRYKALHDYYAVWEVKEVLVDIRSIPGLLWNATKKILSAWMFFLGPALSVPLVFLPRMVRRDRRMRALAIIGAVTLVALELDAWFYAHYAAPITALMFAFVLQGIRHLRVWRRKRGEGRLLARAVPAICMAMIVVRLVSPALGLLDPPGWPMTWYHTPQGNTYRARVLARLSAMDGKQLAIVRYGQDHNAPMNEWVYNRADIDASKVVWARDMDPAANRELLDYFHDRKAWLVEADEIPPKVSPYR